MATLGSHESIYRIVKDRSLKLDTDARGTPNYNGVVVIEDKILAIEFYSMSIQLYNKYDDNLKSTSYRLSTSHKLGSYPMDICIISKTELAVCLLNGVILSLSLKWIGEIKRVKSLDVRNRFRYCDSMAKLDSENLVVIGWKNGGSMMCWGVVSITSGRIYSTHDICKAEFGHTHVTIKENTIFISIRTFKPKTNGVYAYDIFNPHKLKFLYQHHKLEQPWSVMADMDCVYVCDSNKIHQLTDDGQLVTIHTVSSSLNGVFYDDQHGFIYATCFGGKEISVYKMEYLHPAGVPIEILKMDDKSIQLFEEALKDGEETVHRIRIMVVGHMGVGKTTLVKRLLGEEVNIFERRSTEGIDVYVNCCDVSLSTQEWIRRPQDSGQDYRLQRIANVLNEQHSVKGKVTDDQVIIFPKEDRGDIREDSNAAIHNQDAEILTHSSEQDIVEDSLDDQQDESKDNQEEESTSHLQEENSSHHLKQSTPRQQEDSPAHQQAESNTHHTEESTSDQHEEYSSSVIQKKSTESTTNTRSMIKLLKDNAHKIDSICENSLLTIWDFAGQYAYYTTHQTFLTTRAVYLLVSDVSGHINDPVAEKCYFDSEGVKEGKVHDLVEVWLNSIHSCASSPDGGRPPVILVGTHLDKLEQGKHHEISKRYFSDIRSYLKDKPTRYHLIDEDFAIDNTVVDSKLKDLKRKIVEVASQQPYWGEKIPARWLLLEQELMRRKADGVKVIPHKDVVKINMEGAVKIENSEELDLFLRFLHETGTILYFSIEILRENIVLDPTWLIDALKSIINAHPDLPTISTDNATHSSSPTDSGISQKWSDFKEKGILTSELIDAVWTKERYPELHAYKDHVLLIMEQLNVIARPRAFSEIGEKIESYYLTPCMLRQESPRDIISPDHDPLMVSTHALCCVFTGNFLPPPIFHRLIAACITRWPVAKKKETSQSLLFCGCCIFDLDLFHRLILHSKNHIVFARITRVVVDEVKTPDVKLCSRVRKFITLNLSKITSYLGQNLKYDLCCWWSPSQALSENGRVAPFQTWCADEGHDSEAPILREHMNHARVYVALVTVCANVLRHILLTYFPEPFRNIYQAIMANKENLTKKTRNKRGQWQNAILLPDQYDLVFPDPLGQYVASVDQFDISLLYVLIRNISTVPASLMGWGKDPEEQPTRDRCLGASVERIRSYRNQIGHSMDGKISETDFDDYWNKIDAVLDDIEQALGRQGFRAELEKQKRQVISVYEAC